MSEAELLQRLEAARQSTAAAEQKIQKIIDLVKKSKEEEASVSMKEIHNFDFE